MLRQYQQDAHDAIYSYFDENAGNPVVVVPTAGGKSHIIAAFIQSVLNQWPDQRILMLTHVKELIEQNLEKLLQAWNEAPVGVYSAGIGRRDHDAPILYAGIQSVYNKADLIGWTDLVIIDEAHLVNHDPNGMYRRFLADLQEMNPMLKVIGFTATPYRTGHGYITEGADTIFSDIAHDVSIDELLGLEYLSPLTCKQTKTQIDVSDVGIRAGEFIHADIEEIVSSENLINDAVDEVIAQAEAQDRGTWLVFCAGVKAAMRTRDVFREKGIECECITGKTPPDEREAIIRLYKAGQIQCLTNANVLTTGFDAPLIDLVAFLRPTASLTLYVQMVGRGMRLSPETDKENCLVLDFAGNVVRHGPVNRVKPRKIRKGDDPGEAPTKTCPECNEILHLSIMTCPACGHVFPPKPKHEKTASTYDILAAQGDDSRWHEVLRMVPGRHQKAGKPDSFRLTFHCGLTSFSKWFCFDHTGYAKTAAQSLWLKMGGTQPAPDSTTDALERAAWELPTPTAILVDQNGQYPDIKKYDMGDAS